MEREHADRGLHPDLRAVVQVILYFNVHPRMVVPTSTMMKRLDYMFHFLLLFFVLFLVLAFMSFWMFRESLSGFQDFGTTLESQIRLLGGASIIADEVEEMHGDMHAMYWLYALTFLIVIFLTLLNFFPAIGVDAFVMVKAEIANQATENYFTYDPLDILLNLYKYRRKRWPSAARIVQCLEKFKEAGGNGGGRAAALC